MHPDRWILWVSFSTFTLAVTLENNVHTPAALPSDSKQIFGGNSAEKSRKGRGYEICKMIVNLTML